MGALTRKDNTMLAEYMILLQSSNYVIQEGMIESQSDHARQPCPAKEGGCLPVAHIYGTNQQQIAHWSL